jgi:hypothetical protein
MMSEEIKKALNLVSEGLTGRSISNDEKNMLIKEFGTNLISVELIEMLSNYKIVEHIFSIPEDRDPSGIGVDMKWLSPRQQVEEAYEYYPGILAIKDGYLPVGMCLMGSGDPYFLKSKDQKYILVRIPHDAIYEETLDTDSIEFICELTELFVEYGKNSQNV